VRDPLLLVDDRHLAVRAQEHEPVIADQVAQGADLLIGPEDAPRLTVQEQAAEVPRIRVAIARQVRCRAQDAVVHQEPVVHGEGVKVALLHRPVCSEPGVHRDWRIAVGERGIEPRSRLLHVLGQVSSGERQVISVIHDTESVTVSPENLVQHPRGIEQLSAHLGCRSNSNQAHISFLSS